MKLYNSNLAPSPRRVRIFLAEKGVSIPRVEVDLANSSTRRRNSRRSIPSRPFRSSSSTTGPGSPRSIAICRYIEALWPEPNLFGLTPWNRQ